MADRDATLTHLVFLSNFPLWPGDHVVSRPFSSQAGAVIPITTFALPCTNLLTSAPAGLAKRNKEENVEERLSNSLKRALSPD